MCIRNKFIENAKNFLGGSGAAICVDMIKQIWGVKIKGVLYSDLLQL